MCKYVLIMSSLYLKYVYAYILNLAAFAQIPLWWFLKMGGVPPSHPIVVIYNKPSMALGVPCGLRKKPPICQLLADPGTLRARHRPGPTK